MGEYIKHPALKEEVKIGRYWGKDNIEAYYPKWVLEKFLSSGYEEKEIIQSFLDDAEKVEWLDYKEFGTSPLLQVVFDKHDEATYEEMLYNLIVGDSYVILLQGVQDDPSTIMLWTTEYGKPFVEARAKEYGHTPMFYENRYFPLEGELDVMISDETNSEERPGFDVDVYDTYDENGYQGEDTNKGDRREDLCRTAFPNVDAAKTYIAELETTYKVNYWGDSKPCKTS